VKPRNPSLTGSKTSVRFTQLERMLAPQHRVQIDHAVGDGDVRWLTAGTWKLLAQPRLGRPPSGEQIERFIGPSGEAVVAVADPAESRCWVPFDFDQVYRNYVSEGWREYVSLRALTGRQLNVYYRVKFLIPRSLQVAGRRVFARLGGLPSFPTWPLDLSVDRLLRFYGRCLLAARNSEAEIFRWFWPRSHNAALILTHDVESAEGLRLAIDIADLEEERGFRASYNIVGQTYPIDHGILRELSDRGFEIGLHGLHHDRSLFASRAAFEKQLPTLTAAARSLGARGFRSPSTHRVHDWIAKLPFDYDCSVPHSDPFEPQPGGCCTLWPYFIGDVVELPYTLSQDHTLLTILGERSVDPWIRQVDAIEGRNGLLQCVSHPDPGYLGDPSKRAIYVQLLDSLREREGLWKALPRDVADWWRRRDQAERADPDFSDGVIRLADNDLYSTFEAVPEKGSKTDLGGYEPT
jgi:peptidoglycan/xylan/chitin deacetylase (PgdA/CDA1 family)